MEMGAFWVTLDSLGSATHPLFGYKVPTCCDSGSVTNCKL